MDSSTSKQNILRNLQKLPHPSSSAALVLGRAHAVASASQAANMASQASASSSKGSLPSVQLPRFKSPDLTIQEATQLLKHSIIKKSIPSPFPERWVSVNLYDKNGTLFAADLYIDIKPLYTLKTTIVALQSLVDEHLSKNPRKYPNPQLVREIDVRYFNEERYAGMPKIVALLGGQVDEHGQNGKVAEFVQWKKNIIDFWEQYRFVMLVGADVQIIEVPILKVRTVDIITDWDGPHGVEVSGGGHAFGDNVMPKTLPTVLPTKARLTIAPQVKSQTAGDISSHRIESQDKILGDEEIAKPPVGQDDNSEALQLTSQPSTIKIENTQTQIQDLVDRGYNELCEEELHHKVEQIVALTPQSLEEVGGQQVIELDDIWQAIKLGVISFESSRRSDELMMMDEYQLPLSSDDSENNNPHTDELLDKKSVPPHLVNTWSYYQQLSNDEFLNREFSLGHLPFDRYATTVQRQDFGDLNNSIAMVPYRHISYATLHPIMAERIEKFREDHELAKGFEEADDEIYLPVKSTSTALPSSIINRHRISSGNHKEVQEELNKLVGVSTRRAEAKQSSYLGCTEHRDWHGVTAIFPSIENVTATTRNQQANMLSARSMPFVPLTNSDISTQNQSHLCSLAGPSRTPQGVLSPTTGVNNYMTDTSRVPSPVKKQPLLHTDRNPVLYTEEFDTYQRIAAMNDSQRENLVAHYGYSNVNSPLKTQTTGVYGASGHSDLPFHQGSDGYGLRSNTQGYSGFNNIDHVPRTPHFDDLRGITGAQNYMSSDLPSFTQRTYDTYGQYMERMHPFSSQNPHSNMDISSSIANAFNGYMNVGNNFGHLQVPERQLGSRSSNRRSRPSSRDGSRNTNHLTPPAVVIDIDQPQDLIQNQGDLRAGSASFASESSYNQYEHVVDNERNREGSGTGDHQ